MPGTDKNTDFRNYMMNLRLMYPTADNELKKITKLNGSSLLNFDGKGDINPKACTLIVSLGGMGTRALNTIKKKYNMEMHEASLPMKKRHVRFLAVDTDNSANNGLTSVSTSSNNGHLSAYELCCMWKDDAKTGMVGILTRDNCILPQTKWFDKRIPSDTILDNCGAYSIRQIGRLMLSIKANYEHVYNCVNNIFRDFTEIGGIESTNVIFVFGAGGGTGSGCIIDLAYLVRKAAMSQAPNGMNADLMAYIFTPDIYSDDIESGKISDPDRLYGNFIACMNDIDNFIEIRNRRVAYTFPSDMFPDGDSGAYQDHKVFDCCVLVGSPKENKAKRTNDEIFNELGDHIITLIKQNTYYEAWGESTEPIIHKLAFISFKMEPVVTSLLSTHPDLPKDASYKYFMFSHSSVRINIDEVIQFMASRIMYKIRGYMFSPAVNDICRQKAYELMTDLRLYPENGEEAVPMDIERLFAKGNNPEKYRFISSRLSVTSTGNGKTYRTSKPYFCQADYDALKNALNSDPTTNVEYDSSWIEKDMEIIRNAFSDMMNGRYTDKDGNTAVDVMNAGPYAAMQLGEELINIIDKLLNVFIGMGSAKSFEYLDGIHQQRGQAYANIITSIQHGKVRRQEMEATIKRAENMVKESASIYLKKEHHPEAITALNKLKAKIEEYTRNNWECICNIFSGMTDALCADAETVIRQSADNTDSLIDISKLGAEPITDKQCRLDALCRYFTDEEKICSELLGRMYSAIESDIDRWTYNDSQNFVLPDTVQKVLSEYFMILKCNSSKLTENDILQRLLFILNTPFDPRMSIEEIFKLFRDKLDPDLPGTREYKWEQVEHHFRALFGGEEQPLDIVKTDIYDRLSYYCPETMPGGRLKDMGITFNDFPGYDMLFLTESAKFLTEKLSSMFHWSSPERAYTRNNAGYAMFKYRFCIPLYALKGSERWQAAYDTIIESQNNRSAGLHLFNENADD